MDISAAAAAAAFAFNVKRFIFLSGISVPTYILKLHGKHVNITFFFSFALRADTRATIQLSAKTPTPN